MRRRQFGMPVLGSLSPMFRISQDFGWQPEKIMVWWFCPGFGPKFYSCALYRVTPSGG